MIKTALLFLACSLLTRPVAAQPNLPVIRSNVGSISIRENNTLNKNGWRISPQLKPDVHITPVKGASTQVSFITDIDSITFTVKPGDSHSFFVLYGKDSALTEIKGTRFVEPAIFTPEYIRQHNKKTTVEVPEMYELANIVFALTKTHQDTKWADEKGSEYYKKVMDHFGSYRSDPFILKIDTLMKNGHYHRMKMDAYSFVFDPSGKIKQSPVYDRISWGNENTLRPYISQLQAFADKTRFLEFYKQNKAVYEAQILAYRDSINTPEMVNWLYHHFPSTRYNAFKIIWSPLVGGNQSANWFENNGFRESQAHVNFPYSYLFSSGSKEAIDLRRGNIVFTEINHAFINPEAEKYTNEIISAFPDKYHWVDKGTAGDGYGMDIAIFNEYMNWGLVSLRYVDYAPKAELDSLLRQNERYMLRRGFRKFPEYNQFLVNLYSNRKKEEPLANLYPKIVAWFRENSH